MKHPYSGILHLTFVAIGALFVSGCLGGVAGFLGGAMEGIAASATGGGAAGSGITLASSGLSSGGVIPPTVHNPEPATMLLLGGGLMALAFAQRRKKTKAKEL